MNPSPSSSDHYAWNTATAQREAELKSYGVTTSPRLVISPVVEGGDTNTTTSVGTKSPWNTAGTWEERDVSTAARTSLKNLITAAVFPAQRGLQLFITCEKIEGAVQLIHVRGKTRVGFELNISATWELFNEGKARVAGGTLAFDAEDSEAGFFDSLRVVVTRAEACASGEAVSCVKASDDTVRRTITAWKDELIRGGGGAH